MTTDREWAYLDKARELRKALRQPSKLRDRMTLRSILAQHGWYEITEPEEGEGEAIVHIDDVETHINGFVMHDGVVFDPGEDNIYIYFRNFDSTSAFIAAVRDEFDKLVKEWYPE